MLAEVLGKCLDLLGLDTFGATHAQGKADDDFSYSILADYSVKIGEVMLFILPVQSIQTLSRHA
jgi:hypothetical protein